MGSFISTYQAQDNIAGYQILLVQQNSPAENVSLEEFFDFITAICHIKLVASDEVFLALLNANVGQPTPLTVYSCRTRQSREVSIIPKNDWDGKGVLGLTIRYCTVNEALQNVRRVLKVFLGSPAEMAGLKPCTDYIIAAEHYLLTNVESFANLTKKFDQQPMNLFVYNVEDTFCRLVQIIPNTNWGGDGALGCAVGSGLLHQLPADALQTPVVMARFAIHSILERVKGVEQLENESVCNEANKDEIVISDGVERKSEALFGTQTTNEIAKNYVNLNKCFGKEETSL